MGELPPAAVGRHRWMFEALARAGATYTGAHRGVYSFRLADGLAETLGRTELRITFQRRLAAAGDVELAMPGSWLHDEMIRRVRQRGRITLVYLPVRPGIDRAAVLRARRRGFSEPLRKEESRYGVFLQFNFNLTCYLEPPVMEHLTVTYDAQRGRVVQRPVGRRTLLDALPAPEPGFAPPPPLDVEEAFRRVWASVQDHVEGRVQELRAAGQDALDRQVAVVESYYRQLIEEEKAILKGRASRRGEEESRNRIELLKVEWERRVKEEAERMQPEMVATLLAVAQIRVPLERWRCRGETTGGGPAERDVWIDLARAEAWDGE